MSRSRTYEGTGGTVDARINLTVQGSVSSPNTKTPKGAKKIDVISVMAISDLAVAGRAGFLLRIGGDAVKNGEQTIVIGAAAATAVQSGGDIPGTTGQPFVLEDADIDVESSEQLTIDAEMLDDDVGDIDVVATLIFD